MTTHTIWGVSLAKLECRSAISVCVKKFLLMDNLSKKLTAVVQAAASIKDLFAFNFVQQSYTVLQQKSKNFGLSPLFSSINVYFPAFNGIFNIRFFAFF